ncbi:MAG: methylated-DNA--[protein]-cysteine S-methyltransferase [Victivallaceae bacterium]|nr:methylated-DNA--[protein]-cysteine S-methyltransferase [Victivallaceae bacterium]
MKYYTKFKAPVGEIILAGGSAGLSNLFFNPDEKTAIPSDWVLNDGFFADTIKQIEEYFRGERTQFNIRLDLQGTDFQKKVWKALLDIPCGQTRSYGDIARVIGNPGASRAVGTANSKNPVPLIVPCHRVINADGRIGGFSSGPALKEKLLKHERSIQSV